MTRQRSSRRVGGQNPCRASCFALVYFWNKRLSSTVPLAVLAVLPRFFLKQTVEFNHLLQKDLGTTASAARILSPNPMRRPLPCLLIQSFFYEFDQVTTSWGWNGEDCKLDKFLHYKLGNILYTGTYSYMYTGIYLYIYEYILTNAIIFTIWIQI